MGQFSVKFIASGGSVLGNREQVDFAVEAPEGSSIRGGSLFSQMMDHFGDNVQGIGGNWTYGDNLAMVNKLTANGMAVEDAVTQTWTAYQASKYGFNSAAFIKPPIGTPGNYTSINVVFTK